MIEINISSNNALPYVQIKHPNIKLLIDTGSSKSILKPSIAEQFYPKCIYQSNNTIKTAVGSQMAKFQASIPAFPEFVTNYKIDFILFDFHDYFDGVLGLTDLINMNFNIDLCNKQLVGTNIKIPFSYRKALDTCFSFSVNPFEKIVKNMPVSVYEGEILTKPGKIKDLFLPQILTVAKEGFAPLEVQNHSDKNISVTLTEPIPVDSFESNSYEIFNIENFVSNTKIKKKDNFEIDQALRTEHMNAEEKSTMIKLCKEYSDIFFKPGDKLTFTSKVKHEIKTTDEIPVHVKTYRYPYIHKEEVQRQINDMLDKGIIRPSSSPWSSPIWIVPKKLDASGQQKWRIVTDFRKLNEKTISDRYPIPNISDILDRLGRAQYFTTLDLASGFHQIEMAKNSIEKTAFTVNNGHYEYTRMPFGLRNSPSTFQRVMDEVLKDLQNKICMVFMDDIIIFSVGLQEHAQNLKLVFSKLREANLKIQLDKCEFLRKEVEFLGHIVTPEGIRPNKKKIEAIKNFPIPKTAREIKSFLGLLGYYRRFIKNFAKLTKPLTKCLKKNEKIEHTQEFLDCVNLCKNVLISEPVLAYPDFEKDFELTTDASGFAIGAILSQNNHPICYASRTLNPAEINYSTIEKELLAIVWSCKYFRPYLFGRKFTIYTDHKPLQWLFSLKEPSSRLVRWRLKLEEFDYSIKYKNGKTNQAADALSRHPPIIDLNALETASVDNNPGDADEIINQFLTNPNLPTLDQSIINEILDIDNTPNNQTNANTQTNTPNTIPGTHVTEPIENIPDDLETVHTSLENPILDIPISERSVNTYKNQIVLTSGDVDEMKCNSVKVFQNTRLYVTLTNINAQQNIVKLLKEFIDPKQTFAIFFRKPEIGRFFITTVQNLFKNSSYKLVQCTKFLEDIQSLEEQQEKLNLYHTTKTCHRGINEMKQALPCKYYWPKMASDIEKYVNNCEICQKNKYDRNPPVVKFNLTPTSSKPLEHIHIDTFKISNESFLTIIDTFSRYGQAYHLRSLTGPSILDNLFIFISHHGLPFKITTDCGTEFKNKELEDFCKLYKIDLHYTTPKNSNSNSPVERFHSTLIEHYRCLKEENKQYSPPELMKRVVLAYNNSIHSVTKFTPFEILKGHINSQNPFDLNDHLIISNYVQNHKENTKLLYNKIQEKNAQVKEKIIAKRNENREEPPNFENQKIAYIKTKARSKDLPKFKKVNVKGQTKIKLITPKGSYHKSCARKPKIKQKSNFQVNNAKDATDPINDPPGPSNPKQP